MRPIELPEAKAQKGEKMDIKEMTDAERIAKAVDLISQYGGIDGGHHKQWVLDQVLRVLLPDYETWVQEYRNGEDGPDTYEWDEGIAP